MNSRAATAADRRASLSFSSFRLDLRGGRLLRGDQAIPLRPKTWAVLMYLVERPGVLVSKDELLDAVWPDVAVTPDTLTKSIGELREALGDDSRSPRCIETVHRRGFRFIAETSETAIGEPTRNDGGARSPLVGRARELERLEALFTRARAGERQLAFVTGAAGVGKTALVDAFLGSVEGRARLGRGASIEQHGPREPYMPILDALERLARDAAGDDLLRQLRRVAPTWLAQMPWLAGDEAEALQRSLQATRPERMLREFAALTEALSGDAPLVLVLEDLHWSDPSTVDLLSFLAGRVEPARLLVIGTYRPAEVVVQEHVLGHAVRSLQRRRQCVSVALQELGLEDVRSYLEQRFPGASFNAELASVVHDYTDGNALFMVAVTDHMSSRGWILDTAPGWALTIAPGLEDLEVPEEARYVIQAQFESLAPHDRAVLEAASVAGPLFAVPLVASALGASANDVELRCEALARAQRFLRTAGRIDWPDGTSVRRYAFAHELYRQASYADVDEARRERLHQRIGEALEAAHGERRDDVASDLADHFGRAGDHARAVRYLAAAAARARQRFASREAISYLESALATAALLPEAAERQKRELELRLALAPPLADLHGFASQKLCDTAERAHVLCREVGTDLQSFQIVYALCHIYASRAEPRAGEELASELEALARRLGTPIHQLLADSAVLRLAVTDCRFAKACEVGARLEPTFDGASAPALTAFGADPVIAAQAHYALALWMVGRGADARSRIRRALSAAEAAASPFTLANALFFSSVVATASRQTTAAAAYADRCYALSREQDFTQWLAPALAQRGWLRSQCGELDAGIEDLEEARALEREASSWSVYGFVLAGLAEAYLRQGAFAAGLAVVAEGIEVAASTHDLVFFPEIWRMRGELQLAARRPTGPGRRRAPWGKARATSVDAAWREGEGSLLRAVELSRASGALSLELRAATSLARAWQARGNTADGLPLLGGVLAGFADDAENLDLREARQLLAELQESRGAARSGRS